QVAHAPRDDQPDVAVLLPVLAHGTAHGLGQLGLRQRHVERDGGRGIVEAVEVGVEAEDAPVVDPDALEDPVAVEQPVVEDRHRRLLARPQLTVNVDQHGRIPQRNAGMTSRTKRSSPSQSNGARSARMSHSAPARAYSPMRSRTSAGVPMRCPGFTKSAKPPNMSWSFSSCSRARAAFAPMASPTLQVRTMAFGSRLSCTHQSFSVALRIAYSSGDRNGTFQPSACRATMRRSRRSPCPPIQSRSRESGSAHVWTPI